MTVKTTWNDFIRSKSSVRRCSHSSSTTSITRIVREYQWSISKNYTLSGGIGKGIWFIKNSKYSTMNPSVLPGALPSNKKILVLQVLPIFFYKSPTTTPSPKSTIFESSPKTNRNSTKRKKTKIKLLKIYPPLIMILVPCWMISVSSPVSPLSNNNKAPGFPLSTTPKNSKSTTHLKPPPIITANLIPTLTVPLSSTSKKIKTHQGRILNSLNNFNAKFSLGTNLILTLKTKSPNKLMQTTP